MQINQELSDSIPVKVGEGHLISRPSERLRSETNELTQIALVSTDGMHRKIAIQPQIFKKGFELTEHRIQVQLQPATHLNPAVPARRWLGGVRPFAAAP